MSTDGKDTLTVARARVDTLNEALAFASVDRHDLPSARVQVVEEDDFGVLEGAFQIFLQEMAEAKAALQQALTEMEASRNELQAKLVTIEQQRATIRELSTPILDLWEGVLTLPMVGALDTQRALEMTEQLLARIVETGARAVIVDVTGVEVVDTSTADHLARLTRAAGLLGAKCIVTGIGPNVARTLVSMGVDLGGVRTLRTLRDGLRSCLAEEESEERPPARARAAKANGQAR